MGGLTALSAPFGMQRIKKGRSAAHQPSRAASRIASPGGMCFGIISAGRPGSLPARPRPPLEAKTFRRVRADAVSSRQEGLTTTSNAARGHPENAPGLGTLSAAAVRISPGPFQYCIPKNRPRRNRGREKIPAFLFHKQGADRILVVDAPDGLSQQGGDGEIDDFVAGRSLR